MNNHKSLRATKNIGDTLYVWMLSNTGKLLEGLERNLDLKRSTTF